MNLKKENEESLRKAFEKDPSVQNTYELVRFYFKEKNNESYTKSEKVVEDYVDSLEFSREQWWYEVVDEWWYSVKIFELRGIMRWRKEQYALSRRAYINALKIFNKNGYNKESRKLLGPRWLCARRLKKGLRRADMKIPRYLR
ncbi:TPA: hypothetical protein H1011_02835 [archaeon]|jgi:hypothetical protein|uniref:Uncharacterized protein n=1 Tax=Candidatus Undinarchaeum marinum TaxID=2756141 RepID=A0A832X5D9_9ARCH|nr:hypothetical protein [Candidatus Undinarchaeum marinum]